MDYQNFAVQLIAPLPPFRAEPRDRLIVRVGHDDPIILQRSLPPNYGLIVQALEQGLVLPLSRLRHADELIEMLAASGSLAQPVPAPQSPAPPWRSARHLHRLK